jgi:hypothetical protein
MEPEPPPLPPSAPPPPPPATTSVLKEVTPAGAVQVIVRGDVNVTKQIPELSVTETPVLSLTTNWHSLETEETVFAFAELLTKPRIREKKTAVLRVANTGNRNDFLRDALAGTFLSPDFGLVARRENRRITGPIEEEGCFGRKPLGLNEAPGSTNPRSSCFSACETLFISIPY